jgi:hypothetical protein
MHDHAAGPQHVCERVMLLLRPAHPQHVVEEQIRRVVRGEPLEFQAGPVQDHLP